MDAIYYLPKEDFQKLFDILQAQGFQCIGPQVREGSIAYAPLKDIQKLPWGISDQQQPGEYKLTKGPENLAFSWANGPTSIKPFLFQPQETLWKVVRDEAGQLKFESKTTVAPLALIGVRPCDVAAMLIQDKVFLEGKTVDQRYQARRKALFTVVVNCGSPSDNCFCVAAGYGPYADKGFDLAMTELEQGFVLTTGSEQGGELVAALMLSPANQKQRDLGQEQIDKAIAKQTRHIPSTEIRQSQPIDKAHPTWDSVAERCISCGSCTQVCPTCFCHREMDLPLFEETGNEHIRSWDSCFSNEHGYTHGHNFREGTKNHYQQWLNHKFVWWQSQFGTAGCTGCGRCMSWCPQKIDITETLTDLYEKNNILTDAYLPKPVVITKRIQESSDVFTLDLAFVEPEDAKAYQVLPGQFNMLYAYGIGEVPISVVSNIDQPGPLSHSIRTLGSATQILASLKVGDYLGLRGPFGQGWPMETLKTKDIIVITGGIGSAPVITAIDQMMRHRSDYGHISILHGVSKPEDFLYQAHYQEWKKSSNTEVSIACQAPFKSGFQYQGFVTDLLDRINMSNPQDTHCIMCGPGPMMESVIQKLLVHGILPENIFLSLERNMQCGLGHCGHCQCGDKFTCIDGPVFSWQAISKFVSKGL